MTLGLGFEDQIKEENLILEDKIHKCMNKGICSSLQKFCSEMNSCTDEPSKYKSNLFLYEKVFGKTYHPRYPLGEYLRDKIKVEIEKLR